MFVFRNTYTDRNGKTCRSLKWYVQIIDGNGTRRRMPAFTNKPASEALGRNIDRLVSYKASGEPLPPELTRWLEGLPSSIREKLASWHLLDSIRIAASRTLKDHLQDWHSYLIGKGNTEKHADVSRQRVERIIIGCKFLLFSDISAAKVVSFLHDQHKTTRTGKTADERIGKTSFNHYLQAFKSFCTWLCKDGRATQNPVAYLDKQNSDDDVRRQRRILTVEEIEYLLSSTESEPTRRNLTGSQRVLLYQIALSTGLRSSELASLRRESFNLAAEPPVVSVAAGYSKRRRLDTLPLSDSIVATLRPFLMKLAKGERLFNLCNTPRTGMLLKEDLLAARQRWLAEAATDAERQRREETDFLLYLDSSNRYADFHAMRHGFVSHLAAAGVHPKVAQELARHSSIELTMKRYTHVLSGQEADAVNKLPSFGTKPATEKVSTGTGG